MVAELHYREADFQDRFRHLITQKRETTLDVEHSVRAILDDVRKRGDRAVIDYTRQFDGLELTPGALRLTDRQRQAARGAVDPDLLAALRLAAGRIEAFHQRQRPEDLRYRDESGIELGYRWTAIAAVGLYVPGGKASYPSSLLMNAIPAKVAGVQRRVLVLPTPKGEIDPALLVAAELAGITEIYPIGGAQAIGALAYGTESIAPVDKIVGPGNAYVAAAKRQVFGTVGIDMIAGPSEVLVVADGRNDPAWIAADLLAQAEHDEAAQSILITDDPTFAARVREAVEKLLNSLTRAAIARTSWEAHGGIVIVERLEDAPPLIDLMAPEHLELAIEDPERLLPQIHHAGAIFLGRHTPEALGDYLAGPNHVLPTARTARFSSGLSTLDFLKRTTLIHCTPEALGELGPPAIRLAEAEGLPAHALSLSLRTNPR